jgi:nicotinate-nucleotide adenylyltransferase
MGVMTDSRSIASRGPVGVLGGTFDPVHWGHLAIAESARETLGLERVLFVPGGQPPHKTDRAVTPGDQRAAMLEAAIADNASFAVSRIEVDRRGLSYTADTLAELVRQPAFARREVWFLLSAEALAGFPTWHEPDRILSLACLAVVPRAGRPGIDPAELERLLPTARGRVRWLEGPAIDVSASDIRDRAASGRSIRYLVPPAVAAYIEHHGLYRREPRSRSQ